MIRRVALILALLATPAAAQTPEEIQAAATNMWVASKICIENADAPSDLVRSFAGVGFEVAPMAADQTMTFSAFGMSGTVALTGVAICEVYSPLVPLETLEQAIFQVVQAEYPAANVRPPARFYRAGCHWMNLDLGLQRFQLEFSGPRESGGCGGRGSTLAVYAPQPVPSGVRPNPQGAALAEMLQALEICLQYDHRNFAGLIPAFAAAGYQATIEDFGGGPENVIHWMGRADQSSYTGVIAAPGRVSCRIHSEAVGVSDTLNWLGTVLESRFPGLFSFGTLEGTPPVLPGQGAGQPCTGYVGWSGQVPITIEVATAGNGPTCQDNGTVQIIINS